MESFLIQLLMIAGLGWLLYAIIVSFFRTVKDAIKDKTVGKELQTMMYHGDWLKNLWRLFR